MIVYPTPTLFWDYNLKMDPVQIDIQYFINSSDLEWDVDIKKLSEFSFVYLDASMYTIFYLILC